MLALSCAGWAAAQDLTDAQIDAERQRIAEARRVGEARHAAERSVCYQRFAVESCLSESRRRLRTETDALRRQEVELNDLQRKRRGAEQLKRLEERQAAPPGPDAQQRQQALEDQQAREARAAEHARERAALAAEAARNRTDFQDRQRARQEDAASAARRRAEAPAERDRYERKLEQSRQRRADLERRNAERDKPPAAPLPVPGR